MSGLGCDRTHGRSGSAQIETNKFQSTLPEGSDRRHQQICGASLRRRVERPHHDTSQVVHLLRYYNLGTNYSRRIEHLGVQRHVPVDGVMMV